MRASPAKAQSHLHLLLALYCNSIARPASCFARPAELRAQREQAIKEAELNRRRKMAEEEANAANLVEEVVEEDVLQSGGHGSADASAFEAEDDSGEESGDTADEEVEAVEFD